MERRTSSFPMEVEAGIQEVLPTVSEDEDFLHPKLPRPENLQTAALSPCRPESRRFSKSTIGASSAGGFFTYANPWDRYKVEDLANYTMTDQRWALQRKKTGLTRKTSALKQRKVRNEQTIELALQFIRNTFKRKECLTYCVDNARSEIMGHEVCRCGLTRYSHQVAKNTFLSPLRPPKQMTPQKRPSTTVLEVDETNEERFTQKETEDEEDGEDICEDSRSEILQANGIIQRSRSQAKTNRKDSQTSEKPDVLPVAQEKDFSLPVLQEVKGVWSQDTCMGEYPTNAYGQIQFVNESLGSNKPAKYVRMTDTIDMNNVLKLFSDYWRLMEPSRPNLVISVIGGAKNFRLDGKKKQSFSKGLLKAVKSTQAWILTGGMNVGAMKSVGDAVNEGQHIVKVKRKSIFAKEEEVMVRGIKCIGVAAWGYVKDNELLINKDLNRFSQVRYKVEETVKRHKNVSLNGDHTHFLLIDNGIRNRYGGADKFRTKLQSKIQEPEPDGLGIPVVILLLDGGISSIVECCMALEKQTPIVIVANTGRAADLLAYALSMTIQTIRGHFVLRKGHKKQLFARVTATLTELDENQRSFCVEKIVECCKYARLITIYDINSCEGMDKYILYALLRAGDREDAQSSKIHQLNLALLWNRPDIAENHIFPAYSSWPSDSLEDLMTTALIEEKVEFVKLLAVNGLIMTDYLTVYRLRKLYNESYSFDTHLGKLLSRASRSSHIYLRDVHCLLESLAKKHTDSVYKDDTSKRYYEDPSVDYTTFEDPYRELLLWAVLSKRGNLAVYLWERCNSPLVMAIISTCIYRGLWKSLGAKNTEIREEYSQRKDLFEKLAIEYLEECFNQDPNNAMGMVERRQGKWGDLDCLEIALHAEDMAFISSPCCQASVDISWRRGMIRAPTMAVIFAIFFPFLVLTRIFKFQKLGDDKGELTWIQKLIVFYKSPISKFCSHSLTFVSFLILYAYVVLFAFRPQMSLWEKLIMFWILSYLLEEINEILSGDASTLTGKLSDNWSSPWNRFDVAAFFLSIVAWALRISPTTFKWGRVAYALNTNIYYIRLFRIYHVSYHLGPKLIIFYRMISEVLVFMALLLIFLLGYGISSQSLLHPWRTFESTNISTIAEGVLLTPYWQMYGELSLEKIKGVDETRCPLSKAWGVEVCENPREYNLINNTMLVFYLIIGNIMLLNLLIAIFTYVFDGVHENSMILWKYEMYRLIREYDKKPGLVPPLNILELGYRLIKYMWKRFCRKSRENLDDFMKETLRTISIFEKEAMATYLWKIKEIKEASLESVVFKMADKIEKISKYVEQEEELRALEEDIEFENICEDERENVQWENRQSDHVPKMRGRLLQTAPLHDTSGDESSDEDDEQEEPTQSRLDLDENLGEEIMEENNYSKEEITRVFKRGLTALPFSHLSRPSSTISAATQSIRTPRPTGAKSAAATRKQLKHLTFIANKVDNLEEKIEDIQADTQETMNNILEKLEELQKVMDKSSTPEGSSDDQFNGQRKRKKRGNI